MIPLLAISILLILLLFIALPFIIGAYLQSKRGSKLELNQTPWFKSGACRLIKILTLKNKGNFHALILEGYVRSKFMESYPFLIRLLRPDQPSPYPYFKTALIKPENSKKDPKELKIILELLLDRSTSSEVFSAPDLELVLTFYDNKPIRTVTFPIATEVSGEGPSDLDLSSKSGNHSKEDDLTSEVSLLNIFTDYGSISCLRTPIIERESQLVEYLLEGLRRFRDVYNEQPELVAISESVVAIAQGRAFKVYEVKTTAISETLTGFFHEDSSMSSPYAFQVVLREVGFLRILLGIWGGMLGKLFRQRGWFYVLAGRQAASVDDCGGTTPPFDKSVVLSPRDPSFFAKRLKEKLIERDKELSSIHLAVVDVNDLGAVDLLGTSDISNWKLHEVALKKLLRKNPQGNEDERRPIVLIPKATLEKASS